MIRETAVALVLIVSAIGAAAPVAAQEAEGDAYGGTHVQFETTGDAVADYAVDGTVILENVTMRSAEEARGSGGLGVDADLETATDLSGAAIESRTEARASVRLGFEGGGEMEAHDTRRGVVQFRAGDEDRIVRAVVAADARAESEGDGRVVVTRDDGGQGVFVVVGDGEVVVDEEGNVTAEIASDGRLVYRQYGAGERDAGDEEAERLIGDGVATAEVYVRATGDGGDDSAEDGGEVAVETVEYGNDTAVETAERTRDAVELTVERTESDGKVVLATVSEAALDAEDASGIAVTVDGEAAARADSYAGVERSASEGDRPRYYVDGSSASSADAGVDVAVGIDHFSERSVAMTAAPEDRSTATATEAATETRTDEPTATPSDDAGGTATAHTDGDGAGFGVLAALSTLAGALLALRRRRA